MDPSISLDVLDKDTTYNPLVGGFKTDGSGGERREAQSYSGNLSLMIMHKSDRGSREIIRLNKSDRG